MDIIDYKDDLLKELYLDGVLSDDTYPNIKKWLRYRTFPCVDADSQWKTKALLKKLDLLQNGPTYVDCIFSFATYFNMFLRMYDSKAAKSYTWLLLYFDIVFSNDKIDEFCKDSINVTKKDFFDCLEQIEFFAKNTHTLGNYMLCPDNKYNDIKGRSGYLKFNDRIELILEALKFEEKNSKAIELINAEDPDRSKNWITWFNENIEKLYLNELFVEKFSDLQSAKIKDCFLNFPLHNKKIGNSYKFKLNEIKEYTEYLKAINEWIENRTVELDKR